MRTTISVATTACVVAALGCGDSTGPGFVPDKRAITVEFCAESGPSWLAHKDEGGQWTRVLLVNGIANFEGTEQQALAMAESGPGSGSYSYSRVSVIYTTATTLEKLGCEDNDFSFGQNIVKGTVANLGDSYAYINIGNGFGFAGYDTTNAFSVYGVNTGPQDLFATRRAGFSAGPDKMIVRRAQTYANNDTIALDFGGVEAFDLVPRALATTGAGNATVYLNHEFQSGSTSIDLQSGMDIASIFTLPADKVVSGDYYRTNASVQDNLGFRGVIVTYKDGGDKTLPFGPAITTPVFTSVSTTPRRVRGELTAPPEYALGASIVWNQNLSNSSRAIEVVVLRDYLGSIPAKWTLEMPDLSAAAGFQAAWHLSSASYEWSAMLIDGPIELLTGAEPTNDSMVRIAMTGSFAGLGGAPAPGADLRGRATPIRPRLFAGRR